MSYARGKKALGICDRCGFTYKLNELYYETQNQIRNGLRVCNECLDQDHPQLRLGELNINDPQALYNSRPDTGESASTRYSSFDPIGGGVTAFGSSTMGLTMNAKLGKLTVSTN